MREKVERTHNHLTEQHKEELKQRSNETMQIKLALDGTKKKKESTTIFFIFG